jgi:predicted transcriptional regulator of viral defense system
MQTNEFVRFLIERHMPVFTLNDAEKILRKSRPYSILYLHRCMNKGFIGRVERGLYYLKQRYNEYEIASHVVSPSYVSMVSALAYYGLTTQIPRVVYVVSTKRHSKIRGVAGFDIVFKKIKKDMLFGYRKEADGNIFIAEPEKALIDIYYFSDINDLDPSALERPARMDINRLMFYAMKSKKRSVLVGIAALLKEYGYTERAKKLAASVKVNKAGA